MSSFQHELTGLESFKETLISAADWKVPDVLKTVNITICDQAAFINGNGVDLVKDFILDSVDEVIGEEPDKVDDFIEFCKVNNILGEVTDPSALEGA
ncbi:hypothetical protein M885DRAFT_563285 [Pelagophyceae sp. CCMP2097]|nr:hypothetical protein M885DRAFT_563285 [Pelagophyceae sp. CCMP2097]